MKVSDVSGVYKAVGSLVPTETIPISLKQEEAFKECSPHNVIFAIRGL